MYVRFEVFTAVTMKNAVFWDVAPCRSCVNRRFGGTYRLHLLDREIRARGTSCIHLLTLVPRSRIFLPWRWRRYFLPKRRFTQDLHGATSQNMTLFKLKVVYHFLINTYLHIKDGSELLAQFQRCFCLRLQDQTLNETSSRPEAVTCL
jgi:hypothetical protein